MRSINCGRRADCHRASTIGLQSSDAERHTLVIELYNKIGICRAYGSWVRACRGWAAAATHRPNHAVEQVLAHAVRSVVKAAYRRGDPCEKRKDAYG